MAFVGFAITLCALIAGIVFGWLRAIYPTSDASLNEFDVSNKVREKSWVLSAYWMPADAQEVRSLRVVVRPHINHNVAMLLARDIVNACKCLEAHGGSAAGPALHGYSAEKTSPAKC
jgi:glutamate decarboxylase